MSFKQFLDESSSKFNEFKSKIKKCNVETHSKLIKEIDIAFKDKSITGKEFSELDDLLFDKFKELNNK